MATNTTSTTGSINLIDRIMGIAEKFSAILICVIFVSISFSLFSSWLLELKIDLSKFFVMGMVLIIPAGLFSLLIQAFRIIRRERRPLTPFNWLMLGCSVVTVMIGVIAFLAVYAIVG